jgi:hypothetical protein
MGDRRSTLGRLHWNHGIAEADVRRSLSQQNDQKKTGG